MICLFLCSSLLTLKGLLHWATCRARPSELTSFEVGRIHDLPQMTHFDVSESRQQPAVFVYLTFLIDEIGQLDNIQLYNLKNSISLIRNVK